MNIDRVEGVNVSGVTFGIETTNFTMPLTGLHPALRMKNAIGGRLQSDG
jgi:hypothetical protein